MMTTLSPFSRVALVTSEAAVGFSCPEIKDPPIRTTAQMQSERSNVIPLFQMVN
jgi:hypothetical protein